MIIMLKIFLSFLFLMNIFIAKSKTNLRIANWKIEKKTLKMEMFLISTKKQF